MDGKELSIAIRKWVNDTVNEIVNDMYAKGVRHRNNSSSKQAIFLLVKGRLRNKFGMPERISITFPQHLVFVKYGVGKYRPKGSGKEVPKDIVDNVIARRFELLADIVADGMADLAASRLFIDKSRQL